MSRDFVRPRYQSVLCLFGQDLLKVSHHSTKFGGHRHCGSEDIMRLVAEEKDSRCSPLNPPLQFISKRHALKAEGISY